MNCELCGIAIDVVVLECPQYCETCWDRINQYILIEKRARELGLDLAEQIIKMQKSLAIGLAFKIMTGQ
jgi:hypothetical protein